MERNRLLTLLVLLLTATTGAWANWTGGTYTATSDESNGSITISDNATLTINQNVTVNTGAITINEGKTLTVVGPGSLVVRGTNGGDSQNGGVAMNGSGCIVVKGNATVTVYGGDGGEGDTGSNGGNGGAAITCSVTIYSGTLLITGGEGGDGQNGGNGGDCFAGSGTFTYYGGNVTANGGPIGDPIELGGGDWGNFGKTFADTYNVVFENQPTSLLDGYSDPITVENIKSANDVIIEGSGADPVPVYYAVKMKDATHAEAANWTIASGENSVAGNVADGLTGLSEGATVTATYGGTRHVKSVKAVVKAGVFAAKTLAEATAEDIGKIAGADGKIYATKADAEAVATGNAVAMIAYIGTASDCTHGLAIALADESGTKNYGAAGTACSGKAAVTGGTWRLPSIKDWQYMFIGCGASGSYSDNPSSMSYTGLKDKLATAQGYALQAGIYWSSTEEPGDLAWYVYFYGSTANFSYEDENYDYYVRACLAF